MNYSIVFTLKRDKLEDDFKVCSQKLDCPIPITRQMIVFIENIININAKSKELFIVKAPVSLEVYTLYIDSYATFKKEMKINFLQTYDGDILQIEPKTQIF